MTKNPNHTTKSTLRKTYLQKRKDLSVEALQSKNENILKFIQEEIDLSGAQFVHVFLPIEKFKEVNTFPIVEYLRSINKQVVVSKSDLETNDMQHFLLEKNTELIENDWGILEPKNAQKISEDQLDIVFVPLLVFDEKGNRIGYGKGYYDKFLSKCRKDCIKIGLSLFPPIQFIAEMEPMDVPLDYGIYPDKVFRF